MCVLLLDNSVYWVCDMCLDIGYWEGFMCVGEYLFLKIDCRVKVKVWIIGRVYRLVYGYVIMYGRDEME